MSLLGGLASLPQFRDYRSHRISSADPSGGNHDWIDVAAGERLTIAEIRGPGCIRHIWMTMLAPDDSYYRRIVLRFFWDGCDQPSVECPIGDFFGLGHARRKDFTCAVMQMSPQDGRGFNSWWPMPFTRHCRVEVENQGDKPHTLYYYFDYEAYDSPAVLDGHGFFHAQWRRENPTRGWGDQYRELWVRDRQAWMQKTWYGGDKRGLNVEGRGNYVMLEAAGDGIYCGAHLDIDIFERQKNDWYGEGDDMVFIDDDVVVGEEARGRRSGGATKGEKRATERRSDGATKGREGDGAVKSSRRALAPAWPTFRPVRPPTLQGTGTEDWCNTAFGPSTEYCAPYHGILLYSGTEAWKWRGKQSAYRYYIEDPIRFRKAIIATIEHGHANKLGNDYSSTAYYYLSKPVRGGPPLPGVKKRLPRGDEAVYAE